VGSDASFEKQKIHTYVSSNWTEFSKNLCQDILNKMCKQIKNSFDPFSSHQSVSLIISGRLTRYSVHMYKFHKHVKMLLFDNLKQHSSSPS
jgi:hypothetical protein